MRIFRLLLLSNLLLGLIGCAPDEPKALYEIDFTAEQFPDFLSQVTGLSAREDWGRWSDADNADSVTLRFAKPLPKHFTLTIKAQAIPGHEAVKIHIGDFREEVFIQGDGDIAEVYPALSVETDTIEIIPVNPVRPKSLNLNGDTRKLGIGLMHITISE